MRKKQWKNAKNMRQKQSWDTDKTSKVSTRKWEMLTKTWCGLNGCQHLKDLWMDAIFGLACLRWSWKLLRDGMKDQDFLIWVAKQHKENSMIRPIWFLKKTVRFFCFGIMSHRAATQLPDAFYLHSIELRFPTHKLKHPRNSSEQLLPEDPNCKEEVCQATDAKRT